MTFIVEEARIDVPEYKPSVEAEDLLVQIRKDWNNAQNQKNRPWRHLRDRDIQTFMRDCRDHYNGYVPPNSEIDDDWKSKAFKRKTRNKVISTIASFLSAGIGLEISAQDLEERIDQNMSQVVDTIYEWSLERENFDFKFVQALLEMIITGTVHISEELVWDIRDIKEITDIDFETGEITHEETKRTEFKGAKATLIPNSEMYPGDAWTFDIQDQPYIIRRQITNYEDAIKTFDKYENWEFVVPGGKKFLGATETLDDKPEDESDEDTNEVEIVYYWSKADDLYAVVVNSVLMTKHDNPIPYPHKQYPIAKAVFEPHADSRFYWGDSLPNKNWDDQEITNQLYRMFIDSTMLKNKPPLFTPNAEMAGTDLIIPGAISAGEDADKITTIAEITQGVSNSEFNMLQLIEQQIDENSIDPLVSGQSPQGDPTATEVRAIVGSAEKARQFNEQFIGSLLIQHAHLRIPNVLWFLTHDDEYKKVVVENVTMKTGTEKGKRQITFLSKGDIPTPVELFKAEKLLEKQKNPFELVFVDKDSVNDYRFHISISAIKRPTRSGAAKVARVLSKFRVYAENELIDQMVNTKKLVESFGDDPDEMLKAPEVTPMQQPGGAQPPQASPTLKTPPGNPQLDAQLAQGDSDMPTI